jgi:GT2 family glycosyltransferase/tetratricopeptide (TPR) repeat protein
MWRFSRASGRPNPIVLADRARDAKQWDAAVEYYQTALARNPYNPAICVQYGHALKEGGSFGAAEAAYRRAIADDPEAADPYLQLGHVLKLQGRTEQAKAAYLHAFSIDRSLHEAAGELAALGCSVEDLPQLLRDLPAPVAADKINVRAAGSRRKRWKESIITRADRARDLGQWKIAARLYRRALERSPGRSPIWVQYAHVLKESGQRAAELAYRQALAYDPHLSDAHLQLGRVLKLRGKNAEAEAAYLRAFALDASSADPLGGLGDLGWSEAAVGELSEMLGADAPPEPCGPASADRDFQVQGQNAIVQNPTRIISPDDWALVGARPSIDVQSAELGDLTVEFIRWIDFQAEEHSATPVASSIAEYDPEAGLHRCTCGVDLDDGPHVVTVLNNAHVLLAYCGINIDTYEILRHDYNAWIERNEARLAEEHPLLVEHAEQMLYKPIFLVLVETYNGASISDTIRSIENQIYANWRVHSTHSPDWSDIEHLPEEEFLIPIRAGDILNPAALYEFANALNASPDIDMIYADEDRVLAPNKRGEPFYKPDWSPDYLETFNYIGYPACFRRSLAERCVSGGGYYDFVLRFSEYTKKIAHLRKVLCHRSNGSLSRTPIEETLESRALTTRLQRTGRAGEVLPIGNRSMGWEVRAAIRSNPLVSIVIPTAGKVTSHEGRDIDLVTNCVSSIHERSSYRNFEIILVDDQDISADRKALLSQYGCRFVTHRSRVFNFSRSVNLGVQEARGDFILLLNDDIEIITREWLERMLGHFEKDHVGLVGVKLLYPNGKLQHVGVVHNCGNPDHVLQGFDGYGHDYFLSTNGVRNFSAVTAACMMVRSQTYRSVSGFTEELAGCFNDTDFCQKIRAKGLYVVYTPQVELTHFESQSRDPKVAQAELDYYHQRWARELTFDPFYNERCLSVARPTFVPAINKPLL